MSDQANENIESMLQETRSFPPPAEFVEQANISSKEQYEELWNRAKDDPAGFWGDLAQDLEWSQPYESVLEGEMPETKWFKGGKINASVNCIDRHLDSWRKNKA
ncbi:MAG: acetyl-coenzyme A synthetase, partial [Planctomycetaceae bacterium]|nr:acetyl-coenzyme A synthetase [Planctomycetaceae bacterium]